MYHRLPCNTRPSPCHFGKGTDYRARPGRQVFARPLRRSLARKTHLRQPTPRSPRTRTDCRGKTRLARSAACFLKNGHAEARSRGGRQPPRRQDAKRRIGRRRRAIFRRPCSQFLRDQIFYPPLGDLASWRLIVRVSACPFFGTPSRSDRLSFPPIVVRFRGNDMFGCAKLPMRPRNWTAASSGADALRSVARLG
jgi:hypothetical protein